MMRSFLLTIATVAAVAAGHSAEAANIILKQSGLYQADSSTSGTFTLPRSGNFSIDVAGNIGDQPRDNGTVFASGFPTFAVSQFSFGTQDLGNGTYRVNESLVAQDAAFKYNVGFTLGLIISQATYDALQMGTVTLDSSNSTRIADFAINRLQGSDVERYNLVDDSYALTVNLSTVPLPASAPMFGAALLALGVAGVAFKKRKAALIG